MSSFPNNPRKCQKMTFRTVESAVLLFAGTLLLCRFHLREAGARMLLYERIRTASGETSGCPLPEEFETMWVKSGIMNASKAIGKGIGHGQVKALPAFLLSQYRAFDEEGGIINEDTWGVRTRTKNGKSLPDGLPESSRCITPPGTSLGYGALSFIVCLETQRA